MSSAFQTAKKGDMLEFPRRRGYSHWAIYKGDGLVIHLTGRSGTDMKSKVGDMKLSEILKLNHKHAVVRYDKLEDVEGDGGKVNNYLDDTTRNPGEIIRTAEGKLDETKYNLLIYNCEHFAVYCRYGIYWSKQIAEKVKSALDIVGEGLAKAKDYKQKQLDDERHAKTYKT